MDEKKKPTLEEIARAYIGPNGIPGDAYNGVGRFAFALKEGEWYEIESGWTYREYLNDKVGRSNATDVPALVEAIMQATPQEWIQKHDAVIAKVNNVIGDGVTSQAQVDELKVLFEEFRNVFKQPQA
jgi:hypothetical protein